MKASEMQKKKQEYATRVYLLAVKEKDIVQVVLNIISKKSQKSLACVDELR